MGRPLFSKSYASSPPVRVESQAAVDRICHKWGALNKFDPDSDEFFANAEYEAFIDPDAASQTAPVEAVTQADADTISDGSSEPTELGGTDGIPSPMATGSDDPAALIADAYPELSDDQWAQRLLRASGYTTSTWLEAMNAVTTPLLSDIEGRDVSPVAPRAGAEDLNTTTVSYRPNRPRSASAAPPGLVPLSALLTQSSSSEMHEEHVTTPMPFTPIALPSLEAAPTSGDPEAPVQTEDLTPSSAQTVLAVEVNNTPVTPQRRNVRDPTQTIFTPSPPPTVTPRIYSWQSHPIPAIPASPTAFRGNRDGPLTNPRARRSFARLGPLVTPAPVMLTNTVN